MLAFAAVTGSIASLRMGKLIAAVKALAIAGTDLRRLLRLRAERLLPLRPADADHPAARRRLRRRGPGRDRRRRRRGRAARPRRSSRALDAQPSVRVDRFSSEGEHADARSRAALVEAGIVHPGGLRRGRARRAGRPAALLRPARLDRAAAPRDHRVDGRRPERPARRRAARRPERGTPFEAALARATAAAAVAARGRRPPRPHPTERPTPSPRAATRTARARSSCCSSSSRRSPARRG